MQKKKRSFEAYDDVSGITWSADFTDEKTNRNVGPTIEIGNNYGGGTWHSVYVELEEWRNFTDEAIIACNYSSEEKVNNILRQIADLDSSAVQNLMRQLANNSAIPLP